MPLSTCSTQFENLSHVPRKRRINLMRALTCCVVAYPSQLHIPFFFSDAKRHPPRFPSHSWGSKLFHAKVMQLLKILSCVWITVLSAGISAVAAAAVRAPLRSITGPIQAPTISLFPNVNTTSITEARTLGAL